MKVAIYSRKSKYTGKGESVENQVQMCREYISFHSDKFAGLGESDISVFEDEGYSGKNLARPRFQQMMKSARQKRFDYIICYRLDRISRSVSDFSSLVNEFNELGVSFICIKEEFDTKTPMGRAMMNIASTFAQLERETTAERVKDNMLLLARTGRWLGGTPPTGYTSEKVTGAGADGKLKTSFQLKQNPIEIQTVRTIYMKYMELQSVAGVGKFLIGENVRSRNGKPYSLPGIKAILTNPVYCIADQAALEYFLKKGANVCFEKKDCSHELGLISYHKRDYTRKSSPRLDESEWVIAVGRHQGVVTGRDWATVQEKLWHKPHAPQTNVHNGYSLLSGLLVCGKCHEKMFAKQRSNHPALFDYICCGKLRGGNALCRCRNLNGRETDGRVRTVLTAYLTEGAEAWRQFERLKKVISVAGAPVNQQAQIRTAEFSRQIKNYVALLGRPGISEELFHEVSEKVAELKRQVWELEKETQRLEQENQKESTHSLDSIIRNLSDIKSCFENLSIPEQREAICSLVDRIEWNGETLRIFLYKE